VSIRLGVSRDLRVDLSESTCSLRDWVNGRLWNNCPRRRLGALVGRPSRSCSASGRALPSPRPRPPNAADLREALADDAASTRRDFADHFLLLGRRTRPCGRRSRRHRSCAASTSRVRTRPPERCLCRLRLRATRRHNRSGPAGAHGASACQLRLSSRLAWDDRAVVGC